MSRSEVALQPAPSPKTLNLLPRTSLGGVVYREHQERPEDGGGCWWFSGTDNGSEPAGRFDLPNPKGTLYLAETKLTAVLERCGRFLAYQMPVPTSAVEGRVVSSIRGGLNDLGDLTHKDASLKVGVTGEIGSVSDYPLTVTWAVGADALGFSGLKYFARFSSNRDAAFAVFGAAGARVPQAFAVDVVESLAKVLNEEGFAPRMLPFAAEAADDDFDDIEAR